MAPLSYTKFSALLYGQLWRRFVLSGCCLVILYICVFYKESTLRRKARYTLATKSKGRSTRHLGDKNYPLSTKSTSRPSWTRSTLATMTVDKVERAGDSRLSTNRRQIGDKSKVSATKSKVSATNRRQSRKSTLSPVCTGLNSDAVASFSFVTSKYQQYCWFGGLRRFDCGSGFARIRTTNVVDLGKWNTVTIHRRDWSALIRLNNGTQASGRSKVYHHAFIGK